MRMRDWSMAQMAVEIARPTMPNGQMSVRLRMMYEIQQEVDYCDGWGVWRRVVRLIVMLGFVWRRVVRLTAKQTQFKRGVCDDNSSS